MKWSSGLVFATLVSALILPADSSAQVWMSAAGGVTIPVGGYEDHANTGWMARAGIDTPLGGASAVGQGYAGAGGFFGSNSHADVDGDKTNLYGGFGTLGYAFRAPGPPVVPSAFFLVGSMTHAFKSDSSPEESVTSLAVGGGVGLSFPLLGAVGGLIEAWYLSGLGINEDTKVTSVAVGVRIPLGGPPLPGCPFLSQVCAPTPSSRP